MNIGFSKFKREGEAPQVCANVTTSAKTVQEYNEHLDLEEEPAIALFVDEYPEEHENGIKVLEGLIDLSTDAGSVTAALQYYFAKVYELAERNARIEHFADLDRMADRISWTISKR